MSPKHEPGIIISSIYHLSDVIEQADAVISILGDSDKLMFPDVGNRPVLRLKFDDIGCSSGGLVAPNRDQIIELVEFTRRWNGSGTLLIHCRAGSSRSVGASLVSAFALNRPNSTELALRIRTAKAYFRPNETVLKLADSLFGVRPGLLDLSRSVPVPIRIDDWRPIRIPLDPTLKGQ